MQCNKKTSKLAFTLVELIVVITILAILWTIAFISLQWYSAQARDSKRLSDIQNIKKSLELFSLNTWKYPLADDYFTISYSWELIRHQWYIWDKVSKNLSKYLNKKPNDPLTWLEYVYSTTHSQTEYEIMWLYESDLVWMDEGWNIVFTQELYAENQDYPKISWNYNWIYVKTNNFYVLTPSIINANVWQNKDFYNDLLFLKSQVITWLSNIPWVSTWWLDITLSVYEWTITENSTDAEKIALVEAIQTAYSWSELASDTMYADLLSRTGTWEMVDFVDVIILNNSTYSLNNWDYWWEWEIVRLSFQEWTSLTWWDYWGEGCTDSWYLWNGALYMKKYCKENGYTYDYVVWSVECVIMRWGSVHYLGYVSLLDDWNYSKYIVPYNWVASYYYAMSVECIK